MYNKKIKFLFGVIMLLAFLAPSSVTAASLQLGDAANGTQPSVSAYDTVAGFSTMVQILNATPKSKAVVLVTPPQGNQITQDTVTNADGSANVEIPDTATKVAGMYSVSLQGTNAVSQFTVYAGDPSSSSSGMFASKATASANGTDPVLIEVRLVDDFLNPLSFHEINVTSSRSEDTVITQNSETDAKGVARFIVASTKTGVSSLTAVDETSGTVLAGRLKITFAGNSLVSKDIGGDPEVLLASADTVAKFRIDNFPATVSINDPISFTVTAVDGNGAIVPSYTGVIAFSSTDTNAKLPTPYTFKVSDQGTMTFNVAATFATVGTQTLTVQEQGNALIKGQKTVQVTSNHNAADGQVRITKPATGTYSLNTLEVAGESLPNSKVRLFDNGQQISEVQASSSGRFTYTTSLLTDGVHVFYAESNGVQSPQVSVTIDSTPSQVEQVDITKQELAPGESTNISIRSDAGLNKVQVAVSEVVTDMEEDPQNPGLYRGTITAPLLDGAYPVNVVITDSVGNVSPSIEVGTINVDSSLKGTGNVSFAVPSAVTGLRATAGVAKVTLAWTAAQAQSGIAFYRIYYGTDPQNLSIVINTTTPATSFEVANLQNGTPYYFQVFGVDTQGNEGDNPSGVVSAVPSATAGVPVLCSPDPCPVAGNPKGIPQDGPETYSMILASFVGGGMYRFIRRRKRW